MTNSSAKIYNQETPHASAAKPRKYLFDAEFDYSETRDDIQSITPKFHQHELEKAKTASYQDGYAAGVSDTNKSIARMAGDQLFVITSRIEDLIACEAKIMDEFHGQIAQVCELITRKVLPALADKGALTSVKNLLDSIKKSLPTDKTISIFVHANLVSEIENHVNTLKDNSNFQAQIFVKSDPSLALSDCFITWDGAGIDHYIQNTMAEIQKSLLRLGKTPLPFEETPIDVAFPEDVNNSDQNDISTTKTHVNEQKPSSTVPHDDDRGCDNKETIDNDR